MKWSTTSLPGARCGFLDDDNRLCKVLVMFIDDGVVFLRTVGNPAVHLTMCDEGNTGSFLFNKLHL